MFFESEPAEPPGVLDQGEGQGGCPRGENLIGVRYCLLFISFLIPFLWVWLEALWGHGAASLLGDAELRHSIWLSARLSAGMGILFGGALAYWAPFLQTRTLETFTFSLVTSVVGGVASVVLCLLALALSGVVPGLDPSTRVSLFLGLYLYAVFRMIRWERWLTAWSSPKSGSSSKV